MSVHGYKAVGYIRFVDNAQSEFIQWKTHLRERAQCVLRAEMSGVKNRLVKGTGQILWNLMGYPSARAELRSQQ